MRENALHGAIPAPVGITVGISTLYKRSKAAPV